MKDGKRISGSVKYVQYGWKCPMKEDDCDIVFDYKEADENYALSLSYLRTKIVSEPGVYYADVPAAAAEVGPTMPWLSRRPTTKMDTPPKSANPMTSSSMSMSDLESEE